MRRLALLGALGVLALALAMIIIPGRGDPLSVARAQDGEGAAQEDALAPLRGAAVYAEFCQACHGPQGQATGTGPSFVAIRYREGAARRAIVEGVPPAGDSSAAMPAYGAVLSEQQVADVIEYMVTWVSGEVPPLPAPNVPDELGAVLYAQYCAGCHGARGQGREVPGFPALDEHVAQAREVSAYGQGTMPGFSVEVGGPLSAEQIDAIAGTIGTWSVAPTEEPRSNSGLAVMIVVSGVVTLLIVGAAYILRTDVSGAEEDEGAAGA